MSQENKNTQPPSSPEKVSFWKALLIKVLRGTSGVLETTAIKLETEPFPDTVEKRGFLQKLQQIWISLLGKIRLIIPAQFSAKLSDTALSGILGGLVVMIFLITSNVFDSKPSQVATVSPNTEIPQVVSTTEPESIVPSKETVSAPSEEETPPVIEKQATSLPPEETASEPEVEIPPATEKQTTSASSEEETVSEQEQEIPLPTQEETEPKPKIEIPPLIEQTPQEETVSKLEIKTPPTPLTPEETLIAAIQNQVGEISLNLKDSNSKNGTFAEIIESIQANFLNSYLTIKINNDWYSLQKKQQDKLAAEILQRSQELDFTHLEITDLQGKLIARNPVVGTEMIIFKRK
ncbi:hypothetical protein [Calothrix sp. CCY 0018]|uniref:hypothetical protein n=1 Tax=Calothrix sp. CCY 0018 TaxID=3103864 RepID=UPI0039C7075E